MRVETRRASPDDVDRAVAVVRASILRACADDHRDDEATLAAWLANKTPERFATWLANPDVACFVAMIEGTVTGVGMLRRSGEILLCYVDPDRLSCGAGRSLIAEMERQAIAWGAEELRLTSTSRARTFYERAGFVPDGEPVQGHGLTRGWPYRKRLTSR